jgi:hypothetical protein
MIYSDVHGNRPALAPPASPAASRVAAPASGIGCRAPLGLRAGSGVLYIHGDRHRANRAGRSRGSDGVWSFRALAEAAADLDGALGAAGHRRGFGDSTRGLSRLLGDHLGIPSAQHRSTETRRLRHAHNLKSHVRAVGALVRQREAFARDQATAFALERSELERRALDARFRLLQAQVEPHFLFNTLANVQTLVESGAPQATQVLKSLIAYLRAAVPRLHETSTTLGRELELVRAYLEVMHMRMPDRLSFDLRIDPGAINLVCPPMTLLTLVENAVRHGVDPSEIGGRIDIEVRLSAARCIASVSDTGVGLKALGRGLGTGLESLRERLKLAFAGDAELELREVSPHGVRAEVSFPARFA